MKAFFITLNTLPLTKSVAGNTHRVQFCAIVKPNKIQSCYLFSLLLPSVELDSLVDLL